jgi:hypothetical protein
MSSSLGGHSGGGRAGKKVWTEYSARMHKPKYLDHPNALNSGIRASIYTNTQYLARNQTSKRRILNCGVLKLFCKQESKYTRDVSNLWIQYINCNQLLGLQPRNRRSNLHFPT